MRTEADLEDALAEGLPHIMISDKHLARAVMRTDKRSKAGKRACTTALATIAAWRSGSWLFSKLFGGPAKKVTWKTKREKPEQGSTGLFTYVVCAVAFGGIIASNVSNPCRGYEMKVQATGLQLLRKDLAAIFREEEEEQQLRAGHRRRRERRMYRQQQQQQQQENFRGQSRLDQFNEDEEGFEVAGWE